MYDNYGYLIHSAKGSTWSKKDHKYIRKYKSTKTGRWVYVYRINKDKEIKLEVGYKDALSSKGEKALDDYAARLKTMDINYDGTFLKDGERRIISDTGTGVWTENTDKWGGDRLLKRSDYVRLQEELPNNKGVGLFDQLILDGPEDFSLNDEMRKDNQKALAKGIKKLRNKK